MKTSRIDPIKRTPAERIQAIAKNVDHLRSRLIELLSAQMPQLDMHVAHYALRNHVKHIAKSISILRTPEQKSETTLTREHENDLRKLERVLAKINEQIKVSQQELPVLEQKKAGDTQKDKPTIMVAGGGPVGFYSAAYLMRHRKEHGANVVLVADKHGSLPIRGGTVDDEAFRKYYLLIGLSKLHQAQLMKFVFLRPAAQFALKHLEMLGKAVFQALGGGILYGEFEYKDMQPVAGKKLPEASVKHLSGEVVKIPHVKCVINAMGDSAKYPAEIKREHVTNAGVLRRTQGAQINFSCSRSFYDKLEQLHNALTKKQEYGAVYIFPLAFSELSIKMQLFPMLTAKESLVLSERSLQRLPQYISPDMTASQKEEVHLVLKTLLLVEFLGHQEKINLKLGDEDKISIRDSIKKPTLCRAFQLRQPDAPPRQVVTIPGTAAVTTWVGGAAMPFLLTGNFVEYGVKHARALLEHLIKNNFAAGDLTHSPAEICYQ